MTIKFPCPHCKKMLSVKEHLAGKKAACPACKGAITIPAPAPTPAAPDIEELAAAAFAHEPAKKEVQEPQFVEFNCYYCDEKVKINAELQGKQAPCPECRRIIKVPLLKKEGPKDWRTVDTRTPLVAQRTEAAPEGAWGSTTSQGRVSRQSLEDAAATPAATAPTGPGRWIVRGIAAVALVGVIGGGWWGFSSWSYNRVESQALARAEASLKEQNLLSEEATAEMHRGIGEYLLQNGNAEQARIRFQQARSFKEESTARERDFGFADLAVSQIELGGSAKEAEERTRIKWETVLHEVVKTLLKIHHHDVRVEAIREVARRLIARKEGRLAFVLPTQVGRPEEVAELTAVIGLEMLAAKQMKEAGELAELALRRYTEPLPAEAGEPVEAAPAGDPPAKPRETVKKTPVSASLIAFFVALDRRDAAANFPPPPPTGVGAPEVIAAGYAEGLGYRGSHDQARATVKTTSAPGRLQALVGLASALVAQDQANVAQADLTEALGILDKELKGKNIPAATLFRLVRVGVRAGMTDPLLPAAKAIPDKDTRGRALLEIVRGKLATLKGRADDSVLDGLDKDTPAHALALAALARHNARVDSPKATRNTVDGWEEKSRPFGYLGVALGSRDAR